MQYKNNQDQHQEAQATNHQSLQKKSPRKTSIPFVDNRAKTVAQHKLQETANNSPQVKKTAQLQAMVDNYSVEQQHPIQKKSKAPSNNTGFQEITNNNQSSPLKLPNEGVLQRAVDPHYELRPGSVVVEDHGFVSEYINGDAAGNSGWIGVEKYKAGVKVGDDVLESPTYDNNFRVAEAGHVLASQNGGLGSSWPNVFAQDGGVNNGPFRSDFENPMRRLLNNAEQDEDVHFRAVLYGDNIEPGEITRRGDELERSDEDTDHEW